MLQGFGFSGLKEKAQVSGCLSRQLLSDSRNVQFLVEVLVKYLLEVLCEKTLDFVVLKSNANLEHLCTLASNTRGIDHLLAKVYGCRDNSFRFEVKWTPSNVHDTVLKIQTNMMKHHTTFCFFQT